MHNGHCTVFRRITNFLHFHTLEHTRLLLLVAEIKVNVNGKLQNVTGSVLDQHIKGRTPTTKSRVLVVRDRIFFVLSIPRPKLLLHLCYLCSRRIMRSLFYSHISSHLLPLISFLISCLLLRSTWFCGRVRSLFAFLSCTSSPLLLLRRFH